MRRDLVLRPEPADQLLDTIGVGVAGAQDATAHRAGRRFRPHVSLADIAGDHDTDPYARTLAVSTD